MSEFFVGRENLHTLEFGALPWENMEKEAGLFDLID